MAFAPQSDKARRVSFGPFILDLRAGELYKGKKKIKVQQLPLQLLGALLENPGEVVAREELKSRLWPADTFVDFEHGLNTAIKKLRHEIECVIAPANEQARAEWERLVALSDDVGVSMMIADSRLLLIEVGKPVRVLAADGREGWCELRVLEGEHYGKTALLPRKLLRE